MQVEWSTGSWMSPSRGRGFTLLEVIIALGLMGIGSVMIAALFPVAILENKDSFDNVIGTIICENAITTAEATLTPGDFSSGPEALVLTVIADESDPTPIPFDSQHYPYADDAGNGFVLLGRRIDLAAFDPNVYQLVAVSYVKSNSGTVTAETVSCTVAADSVEISGASAGDLRVGSPLIHAATGDYATIIAISATGDEGTLDRPISDTDDLTGSFFVICEATVSTLSPAMTTMSVRTGLRP